MTQKDDRVYIQHMINNSNKAIIFVKDISREDFDKVEQADNLEQKLDIQFLFQNA